MDDDIREALHYEAYGWTEQQFLDAYVIKHREKFGRDFIVN